MERKFTFEEGEFYHVYNRGVDKNKIFFDENDFKHFLRLLHTRNSFGKRVDSNRVKGLPLHKIKLGEQLVDIVAYAMLDNHFHLLLKERTIGGVSKFMGKFMTAYSMYINTKYRRTGPLMCRPYRAKHVDSDRYFRWLVSYIHLNPLDKLNSKWKEKGIKGTKKELEFLRKYRYSSYYDYFVSKRAESVILNKDALPIDIRDLENLKDMLDEHVKYRNDV